MRPHVLNSRPPSEPENSMRHPHEPRNRSLAEDSRRRRLTTTPRSRRVVRGNPSGGRVAVGEHPTELFLPAEPTDAENRPTTNWQAPSHEQRLSRR